MGANLAKIDREQKADQTPPPPSKAVVTEPEQATDSLGQATINKARRSQTGGLAPTLPSSLQPRSRHSSVIDRGQANASQDDLEKLSKEFSTVAPPLSGLAEATTIAPERTNSGLPPPMSEPAQTLGVIVSAEPTSPPTLIPGTDGTSTRPSKGGIAYPFSLKVDGQSGHRANASTVTLQSVDLMTPPAIEESKQLGDAAAMTSMSDDNDAK